MESQYRRGTPPKRISQAQQRQDKKLKTSLTQLLVSLALFACVFLGQGVFPHKIQQLNQDILRRLATDIDLSAAFSQLGLSLSQENPLRQEVEDFCQAVFGFQVEETPAVPVFLPQSTQDQPAVSVFMPQTDLPALQVEQLSPSHYLGYPTQQDYWPFTPEIPPELSAQPSPEPEEASLPLGTILASYPSDLPDTHTQDYLYLGDAPTATPAFGVVTSSFGPRDNPFTGEPSIHSGTDIGGQVGDPIYAWRDGVVETAGHTSTVGLYLRVNHADGFATFYAHCDELLVEEGEILTAGQEIAKLGATGKVTGPHLHFEITWNQRFLDPIHYIQPGDPLG